jgi:tetratricopeptide (TPR) repeat protein
MVRGTSLFTLIMIFLFTAVCPTLVIAQSTILDPLDPNARPYSDETVLADANKTAEELLSEAELLFQDERPLDARTKLLLALSKDPKSHRAHAMLAAYYYSHVGHFKLALKYTRRALQLLQEQNGPPPYEDPMIASRHAHYLNLLAESRLNLDDYEGALAVLDEYESYNYFQSWYPASRAWVLMKTGRLDEAIKTARFGLLTGADVGRSLNILGILLSLRNDREASIEIFRQAIAHEFALGSQEGHPSTPLNNVGEVYRETFQEPLAERSWMQAVSLPNGCDHVLPALNLATIRLERLDIDGASAAIDNFESCVAQFPLRNGEEHRALVHLIRGRIALYNGKVDSAIEHLRAALQRQQWFGRIGTDIEDLQAGALSSLAIAIRHKLKREKIISPSRETIGKTANRMWERLKLQTESWWLNRRVLQLLIDHLNYAEDIYSRNTDRLFNYSTLGSILTRLPTTTLERRLALIRNREDRGPAENYYLMYLAENRLYHGDTSQALQELRQLRRSLRKPADAAASLHIALTIAQHISTQQAEYDDLLLTAFTLNRMSIPSYGLRLPVNFSSTTGTTPEEVLNSAFLVDSSRRYDFLLTHGFTDGTHSLRFTSRTGIVGPKTVTGGELSEVITRLAEEIFSKSE